MKTKVKAFNNVVNTISSDNEIPKGIIHYVCITAINIVSVMKVDKRNICPVLSGKMPRWSDLLILS